MSNRELLKARQENRYAASDLWLLMTISWGKKGTSLVELISSGDHYNHAIISLEEINDGISRLEANGFIKIVEKSRIAYGWKKIPWSVKLCLLELRDWLDSTDAFTKIRMQKTPVYKEVFTLEEYQKALSQYYKSVGHAPTRPA